MPKDFQNATLVIISPRKLLSLAPLKKRRPTNDSYNNITRQRQLKQLKEEEQQLLGLINNYHQAYEATKDALDTLVKSNPIDTATFELDNLLKKYLKKQPHS